MVNRVAPVCSHRDRAKCWIEPGAKIHFRIKFLINIKVGSASPDVGRGNNKAARQFSLYIEVPLMSYGIDKVTCNCRDTAFRIQSWFHARQERRGTSRTSTGSSDNCTANCIRLRCTGIVQNVREQTVVKHPIPSSDHRFFISKEAAKHSRCISKPYPGRKVVTIAGLRFTE